MQQVERKVTLARFSEWDPKQYLRDYYSVVEQDERATLRFLVTEAKKIENKPVALEFGIGPTLHHLLPISPYVSEIHVSDYLESNLNEVRDWKEQKFGSHNWHDFTRLVLQYEGNQDPSEHDMSEREKITRERISKFLRCNASKVDPLSEGGRPGYDFVLSCYCADSATRSKASWRKYMTNIVSLVRPGGFFVTAALRKCRYYRVGEKYFPCADIDEADMSSFFDDLDFEKPTVNIVVEDVPEHQGVGYGSILLASGYRNLR